MTHSVRRIALAFGLLALWLQLLAPTLATTAQHRGFDGRSVICRGSTVDSRPNGGGPSVPHAPACDQCVLCHALAGPLSDGRPVFTLFDYPVSSPLRWIVATSPVPMAEPGRDAQPRGPPILA